VGVIGPLRKMLNYEMLPGMDMVVLVFTMDGFYRLFQTQLDQIEEDKVVSPDLYFQPAMFDDLWMVLLLRFSYFASLRAIFFCWLRELKSNQIKSISNKLMQHKIAVMFCGMAPSSVAGIWKIDRQLISIIWRYLVYFKYQMGTARSAGIKLGKRNFKITLFSVNNGYKLDSLSNLIAT
jgi:hypothetical protein